MSDQQAQELTPEQEKAAMVEAAFRYNRTPLPDHHAQTERNAFWKGWQEHRAWLAARTPVPVERPDDQELTPEGCTFEEAAITEAERRVVANKQAPGFDRWDFEEGWREGREYEARLPEQPDEGPKAGIPNADDLAWGNRVVAEMAAQEAITAADTLIATALTMLTASEVRGGVYWAVKDKLDKARAALAARPTVPEEDPDGA